ncbi:MAG: ribosomal protein S18-alanine N-acetyltransferase [Methanocellales archaeon]|nr:ribosomal protein S18-alanine N-acetyltransferase [Methanocellales archaeon]
MIRSFQPADLDRVCDIERTSFPSPWSTLMFIQQHHMNPDGFFVAIRSGKLIGYVIVRLEGKTGHLLNLAVDPRFRRQGVGGALVEFTIDRLRKEGAEEIWLEVRISNHVARAFYSALGFKEKRIAKKYYLSEDAIIMTKKLLHQNL